MPASIPDLTQPLATLLAGDLSALDVDIASPATPNPVDWGEAVRGTLQGLVQRMNGEVQLPANVSAYPRVVRDLDYTALSSSTPAANGTLTVDGVTHQFQNNTGAAVDLSLCDVLSGTGIRLRYKTSGAGSLDVSSTNDTAGGFYATLANLIPSHSQARRYCIMWHVDQAGGVANAWATSTYQARFFLRTMAGTGIYAGVAQHGRGCAWGSNSGGVAAPAIGVNNGATNAVLRTGMLPTTYNVVALVPTLGGGACTVLAGIYSGGWPSFDILLPIGTTETSGSGNGAGVFHNLAITRAGVWLAGGAGVVNPHGVDVHRCRVLDLGA